MPRGSYSWNVRKEFQSGHSGIVAIDLITIEHDALDEPIRLSSDPTEVISLDPLRYGTRSRGNIYWFVILSSPIPDERDNTPIRTTLTIANINPDVVSAARSVTTPATVMFETVLSTDTDTVVDRISGMHIMEAGLSDDRLTLQLSREMILRRMFPFHRIVKQWFPTIDE
jgi:hypothetical protein